MTPEQAQNVLAEKGRCVGEHEIFFSDNRKDWAKAKTICRKCPVMDLCLGYALETKQVYGVWGGADQRQLREAVGLDAKEQPFSWGTLRCPSCRTAQPAEDRDIENATNAQRRGWINVRRFCRECHIEWMRVEPRNIPRKRRSKK